MVAKAFWELMDGEAERGTGGGGDKSMSRTRIYSDEGESAPFTTNSCHVINLPPGGTQHQARAPGSFSAGGGLGSYP